MIVNRTRSALAAALVLTAGLAGAVACAGPSSTLAPSPDPARAVTSRLAAIPAGAIKQGPETDAYPPILHSSEWSDPIPLPAPVNTAGTEDSPFIGPDGRFYVWFTPSPAIPVEKQLSDGVTGIYVFSPTESGWGQPERVILQAPGEVALDGCAFVGPEELWFCTARAGLVGLHWFMAEPNEDGWRDWRLAEDLLPQDGEVGELHFSADGRTLLFHANRAQGAGGLDLWMATRDASGAWSPSVNLAAVNTEADEGWPYLSPDGQELWFTRIFQGSPAIFRSIGQGMGWSEPELIVERFAGEPTFDAQGNLYFTHHYFRDGVMIEADIYVARRLP